MPGVIGGAIKKSCEYGENMPKRLSSNVIVCQVLIYQIAIFVLLKADIFLSEIFGDVLSLIAVQKGKCPGSCPRYYFSSLPITHTVPCRWDK